MKPKKTQLNVKKDKLESNSFQEICKTCCNLSFSHSEDIDEQSFDLKTNFLEKIYYFIEKTKPYQFTDKVSNCFLLVVEKNLFKDYSKAYFNEPKLWQHKELIYLSLNQFLNKIPEYLSFTLIYKLSSIMCLSKDERERIHVLELFQRYYNEFEDIQNDFRAAVSQQLTLCHCSSELLEFVHFMSEQYTKPLKRCHRKFFIMCILPLHSNKDYCLFQPQLVSVIFQYIQLIDVQKEQIMFLKQITSYIISHWPISERKKQWPMIRELIDIIVGFSNLISNRKMEELFDIINKYGICSQYSQISRQTMSILTTPQFEKTAKKYKDIMREIIMKGIKKTYQTHWDESIKKLSKESLDYLSKLLDVKKKQIKSAALTSKVNQKVMSEKEFIKNWNNIQKIALRRSLM